jgi:hypoxanthine phosphoribosyltransferase
MAIRQTARAPVRPNLPVDWPFFGELCRGLALKVWNDFQPDLVVGIARAGVVPGAVIASMLGRDFASITAKRSQAGEQPSLISRPTMSPRGRSVLLVDGTCDSGDTLRLALSVMKEEGAREVRTAVVFSTGGYRPDYYAMQQAASIELPWDRDRIVG